MALFRLFAAVGLLAAVAGSSSGCGSTDSREADYPPSRPLAVSVGIFFDEANSDLPAGEVLPPSTNPDEPTEVQSSLRFTRDANAVLAHFIEDLSVRAPLVSYAQALEARTLDEALREGDDHDYIIGLRLTASSEFEYEVSPGFATLEIFTWLFGGIPAWFVPTQEYAVNAEMGVDVTDVNHPDVQSWLKSSKGASPGSDFELIAKRERTGMSLHDRSPLGGEGALDYVLTIVIPPLAVTAENSEIASEGLTHKMSAELHNQLEPVLREELVRRDIESPLRVVFGERPVDANGILGFDLISDGASKLKAFDVHRIALDGTVEGEDEKRVPVYRWQPTAEQLQALDAELRDVAQQARTELSATLEDAGDSEGADDLESAEAWASDRPVGRLPIVLADPIPLVSGRNVIKVRVLREDGVRVSRTVVVFGGEEK